MRMKAQRAYMRQPSTEEEPIEAIDPEPSP
jgi:hypothetical protein